MHVIDSLEVGGAERALVDLVRVTAEQGTPVSVCVTRSRKGPLAEDLPEQVDVLALPRERRFDLSALKRFSAEVEGRGVSVIHIHGRSTFSFVAAAKTLCGLDAAALLQDHYGDPRRGLWRLRMMRGRLSRYVGFSDEMGHWALRAGVPAERIETIPGAIDLMRGGRARDLRRELALPQDTRIAVAVGGVRPEKGYDVLLRALAHPRPPENLRLLVIGGVRDAGYHARCLELTWRLGLEQIVTWAGERRDAEAWMRGADIALSASRVEAWPISLAEALGAGLPLAATRAGALAAEAARAGCDGFVEPGNPAALRGAIDELLGMDGAALRSRGERGRRIARELFDMRARLPRWLAAYEQAAGCAA
jgi:glycosyltransferase involved in cell wall biosynthesis